MKKQKKYSEKQKALGHKRLSAFCPAQHHELMNKLSAFLRKADKKEILALKLELEKMLKKGEKGNE